jgi:hypothetical protein
MNVHPFQPPKKIKIGKIWTVPTGWQAKITIVNPDPCEEDQEFELEEGDVWTFNLASTIYRIFVRLPDGQEATYQLLGSELFLATQALDYLVTQDNKKIIVKT